MGETAGWLPIDWPTELATIEGPGVITRMWFQFTPIEPTSVPRDILLRIYWDGEEEPSVEVPVGDFFGSPFQFNMDADGNLFSSTNNAYSCNWPMPFERSARIELWNQGFRAVALGYEIDYLADVELPSDVATFHSQWRRENPVPQGENFVALQAEGRGLFAGAMLVAQGLWRQRDTFLRAPVALSIDGERSLFSVATPSYFNMGWFNGGTTPVLPNASLIEADWDASRFIASRLHLSDPVPFGRSLGMTFGHGVAYNSQAVDYAVTTFWYQQEPHAPFPPMPAVDERLASEPAALYTISGAIEAEDFMPGALWETQNYDPQVSRFQAMLGKPLETLFPQGVTVQVDALVDGEYQLGASFIKCASGGKFALEIDGQRIGEPYNTYDEMPLTGPLDCVNPASGPVIFGSAFLRRGRHDLTIVPILEDFDSTTSWIKHGDIYDEIVMPRVLVLDCVIFRGPDPGMIAEAELLPIAELTGGVTENQYSPIWSNDYQVFWHDTEDGNVLEFEVDIPQTWVYDLAGQFTRAKDYGIVQVEIDGVPVGRPIDLYTAKPYHTTGPLTIGNVPITYGNHRIGLRIVGKNPAAEDTWAGVDYFLFHPTTRYYYHRGQ